MQCSLPGGAFRSACSCTLRYAFRSFYLWRLIRCTQPLTEKEAYSADETKTVRFPRSSADIDGIVKIAENIKKQRALLDKQVRSALRRCGVLDSNAHTSALLSVDTKAVVIPHVVEPEDPINAVLAAFHVTEGIRYMFSCNLLSTKNEVARLFSFTRG